MNQNRHTVAVIAPNWLGDAVMSLPLVGFLASLPEVALRVIASPYTARVFMGLDAVADLTVLGRSGWSRGLIERRVALRKMEIDGAVILPTSLSSALTVFLSGVRRRVGFADDGRNWLLTNALKDSRQEHLSNAYLQLGRKLVTAMGLDANGAATVPRIHVFERDREGVRRILKERGAPMGGYAVVLPGATYGPTKHWPHEKYKTLVNNLRGELPVVLAGGGAERSLCESIVARLPDVYNLAGETSLGELFALMDSSGVVVANDSGAPHAGASLAVPVFVIFGSTSPVWTRPIGESVRVIREPVQCSPCFLRVCPTQLECYEGIQPDRVFDEVIAVLRERRTEEAG